MMPILSDQQKIELLSSIPNKILYSVSTHDIQAECIQRYERLLNDTELEKAEKLLEWGIGENLNLIYDTIFSEIKNE
jgi:hypothetical protein